MAGGYKLFSTGEVLTAANVNNYLMNQTVMVFASAAARTTALSGVLAEGMISYRSDAKVLEIYNGTSWITESAFVSPLTTKGDVHTYSTTDARLGVGTTNQTLIVDSTQTTGLKWAASPQSTLSAKGSLVSASAANTLAELTVGSDGQTLVADSSTSTGLRYQTGVNTNAVINGGMDIWQRGTSFTTTSATTNFAADRWCIYNGRTGTTYSRQSSGLTGFNYSMRVQRDSGNATTSALYLTYTAETQDSLRFAGQTVTVSFYAKAGANYSSASSALTGILTYGTGTDQNIWSFTGSTQSGSTTATLTTSWQRFTFTASVSSSATELGLTFVNTPVGTAGANDYFEITGVQLELGSVATTFKRAGGTLQGELQACQRYYNLIASGVQQTAGPCYGYSSARTDGTFTYPAMRTLPTLMITTGTGYYVNGGAGGGSFSTFTALYATTQNLNWYSGTTSNTIGYGGFLYTNNASASIALSAEL